MHTQDVGITVGSLFSIISILLLMPDAHKLFLSLSQETQVRSSRNYVLSSLWVFPMHGNVCEPLDKAVDMMHQTGSDWSK